LSFDCTFPSSNVNFGFRWQIQIQDASRGVAPGSTTDMIAQLQSKGVKVIQSTELSQGAHFY
jgi:hypothetical protein